MSRNRVDEAALRRSVVRGLCIAAFFIGLMLLVAMCWVKREDKPFIEQYQIDSLQGQPYPNDYGFSKNRL